jgi:hypothetical protein
MKRYLVAIHHLNDYDPSGASRGPISGVGLLIVRKESRT